MDRASCSPTAFEWPEPLDGTRSVARYRTLWISDLHLGTKGCRAESLCRFLESHDAERLYLVGDVIDGWQLGWRWFWTGAQTRVVQAILDKARHGTRVVYIPGNHDAGLREYGRILLAGVEVADDAIHVTADGRRLWVLHGDQFDVVVRCHRWLAHLGDWAYQASLVVNRWLNRARGILGMPYWSLSAYLKQRVKDAVSFVGRFEQAIAHEAKKRGLDGVVCGHIHKAELRDIEGLVYANDGDWVESCTALAEHHDGTLEILYGEVLFGRELPARTAVVAPRFSRPEPAVAASA